MKALHWTQKSPTHEVQLSSMLQGSHASASYAGNRKWPPCLFSFQWILNTLALVLTLAQGLYPLSQLPVPHILMVYIAIMLLSFLRYLSLRETLHCTDVSRQWCAYRYIGNKPNTKKFSKIKWKQKPPCSSMTSAVQPMQKYNAWNESVRECFRESRKKPCFLVAHIIVMAVCVCVSVFGYMFMRAERGTFVDARDQHHVSFSVILHFSFCDIFLLNLELVNSARLTIQQVSWIFDLGFPTTGITGECDHA